MRYVPLLLCTPFVYGACDSLIRRYIFQSKLRTVRYLHSRHIANCLASKHAAVLPSFLPWSMQDKAAAAAREYVAGSVAADRGHDAGARKLRRRPIPWVAGCEVLAQYFFVREIAQELVSVGAVIAVVTLDWWIDESHFHR